MTRETPKWGIAPCAAVSAGCALDEIFVSPKEPNARCLAAPLGVYYAPESDRTHGISKTKLFSLNVVFVSC